MVIVEADNKTYCGKIVDIVELDYYFECKVVLFQCDWVNVNSRGQNKDKRGFTLLNFSHRIHEGGALKDDPYIFLSKAQQVFYVEDKNYKGWEHVIRVKPSYTYCFGVVEELYPQCMPPNICNEDAYKDLMIWAKVE